MNASKELARQFREAIFGGNWTSVNLKELLSDVDWQLATAKFHSLNTIADLSHHMTYYFEPVRKVLNGHDLIASDKESWQTPVIKDDKSWEDLKVKRLKDAEAFAHAIENFSPENLDLSFIENQYGNYFRNLAGIIEHTHYHLGQIALIKKLLRPDK